jgi:nitrogen fixation protein NifU and related proteins
MSTMMINPDIISINSEEEEIYRENILDHYKNPRNFGTLKNHTIKNSENNPVCGDNIEITILLENNIVKDARFQGKGCAISVASASMLTEKTKNLRLQQLKNLKESEILDMLGVPLGAVRRKCGLLSLRVLLKGLNKSEVQDE